MKRNDMFKKMREYYEVASVHTAMYPSKAERCEKYRR